MCEDKQQVTRTKSALCISLLYVISLILLKMFVVQLILSLEKRLVELSETLKKVRDGFLEKSADLAALQRQSDGQVSQSQWE